MRLIGLKHLSSVRLTIVLLIVIVVASIVGTIIPQTWTQEQYKDRYGDTLSSVLIRLQLTDVYHSYWYMALLLAFCVNLCVCSIRSFGPLVKSLSQSASTAGRVEIADLPFHKEICFSGDIEDVESKVKKILTRRLYRLKYSNADSGVYYFERGKISRLGPLMTHASIVIILIGGILVGMLGFKEYKTINVGETVDVPHSDFQVRADDFKVEFYPNSRAPKEYTSKLTIIENNIPRLTDTIEVNHPMRYKGVKFYQMGYGQIVMDTIEIELSKGDGEVLGTFWINKGEIFEVPDSQLKIGMAVLIPDFVMDSAGNVGTRSMEPKNPAAFLELYEGDELEDHSWIFLRFPEFPGFGESDYSLKFLSITTKDYTQLQISSDPGLPVVWFGSLLMVAGLFLSFYVSHKRLWIKFSRDNDKYVATIGGRSYKNRAGFEREFDRLNVFLNGESDGDQL